MTANYITKERLSAAAPYTCRAGRCRSINPTFACEHGGADGQHWVTPTPDQVATRAADRFRRALMDSQGRTAPIGRFTRIRVRR